jgi:hypothetical protein
VTIADLLGCAPKEARKRELNDFYPTASLGTLAFLQAEAWALHGPIWEPFAGNGAISNVLKAHGHEVIETDLIDRGIGGQSRVDFLMERKPLARTILSNPPFKLAEDVIEHAVDIGIEYLALLLKSDFLQTASRYRMVEELWRPRTVYALTFRLDFTGEGSPPMNTCWYVFDRSRPRTTEYRLLEKPVTARPLIAE